MRKLLPSLGIEGKKKIALAVCALFVVVFAQEAQRGELLMKKGVTNNYGGYELSVFEWGGR